MKSMRWTAASMLVAVNFATGTSAQICDVSAETHQRIEAVLCSGNAPEYEFTGDRCFELSLAQRLEDSAAQAAMLEACGYSEVADDLRGASRSTAEVMAALSVCTSEPLDTGAMFDRAETIVQNRPGSHTCTAANRHLLEERLPVFRDLIGRAADQGFAQATYRALGVEVDAAGNVTER